VARFWRPSSAEDERDVVVAVVGDDDVDPVVPIQVADRDRAL
jgi:hypothetical protein